MGYGVKKEFRQIKRKPQRQIVKDFLIKFTENSQKVPEALYGS